MALDSLQAYSDQLAEAVEKVVKSVARVDARNRVSGSGMVWSADGVIVTANHVVEREEDLKVQLNGNVYEAELAGRDPTTDIAVLRVKATGLPAADIADAAGLKMGHLVFAVGRPWDGQPIASAGIVSALGPFPFGPHGSEQFREGLIRSDVTLYPGFSGGPLADARGRVVGMNTSVIGRDLSVAVPAGTLARIVPELVKSGRISRGYLGVALQKIPLAHGLAQKVGVTLETGLMVLGVEPGTPAEKAGFLPGDILVGMNETPIGRLRELRAWLSTQESRREVQARIIRGGKLEQLAVTVDVR